MIEPPVSVPTAKPTRPAAVADAGPADDPLEPRDTSHGFRVLPPNHTSPTASPPAAASAGAARRAQLTPRAAPAGDGGSGGRARRPWDRARGPRRWSVAGARA